MTEQDWEMIVLNNSNVRLFNMTVELNLIISDLSALKRKRIYYQNLYNTEKSKLDVDLSREMYLGKLKSKIVTLENKTHRLMIIELYLRTEMGKIYKKPIVKEDEINSYPNYIKDLEKRVTEIIL